MYSRWLICSFTFNTHHWRVFLTSFEKHTKMNFEKNTALNPLPLNVVTTNNNALLWFVVFSNQHFRISVLNRIYLCNIILQFVFLTQNTEWAEIKRVSQFGANFFPDVWAQHMEYPCKNSYNSYDTRRKLAVYHSL